MSSKSDEKYNMQKYWHHTERSYTQKSLQADDRTGHPDDESL